MALNVGLAMAALSTPMRMSPDTLLQAMMMGGCPPTIVSTGAVTLTVFDAPLVHFEAIKSSVTGVTNIVVDW